MISNTSIYHQVHKLILNNAIGFFKKLFAVTPDSISDFNFEDKIPTVYFVQVMDFVYSGQIKLGSGNINDISIIATLLEVNNMLSIH